MGLWARLCEWHESGMEEPNNYRAFTLSVINDIHLDVRACSGDSSDDLRPIEALRLKEEIRACSERGGKINYRKAVALWQHGKVLYAEWITDEDKPAFVERWKFVPDEDM